MIPFSAFPVPVESVHLTDYHIEVGIFPGSFAESLHGKLVDLLPQGVQADGRIRITRQGKFRYGDAHEKAGAELVSIPLGPRLYEPVPGGEYDIDAVMEGIISITPVTLERTNLEVYGKLCNLIAE